MKRKIIKAFLHFVAIIVFRIKKVNEDNMPKVGAFILCGNHIHALDAPVLIVTNKRKIDFVAKEELYKNKLIEFLGKTFDIITIKRDSADIDAMKKCLKTLKQNEILGIFPEGTRNGMEKHAEVKTGAAYIALKTGVPVVPVGIQGSFKFFSKVTYNFGKPLDFSKYASKKPDKETLEKVTKEIMDNVIKLTKEEI